jgi:hypothetical protein
MIGEPPVAKLAKQPRSAVSNARAASRFYRAERPALKMSREDAERLRALLRHADPADSFDPSALLRVGKVIAQQS